MVKTAYLIDVDQSMYPKIKIAMILRSFKYFLFRKKGIKYLLFRKKGEKII